MKGILLSAFGQFGSYRANSTELVANRLRGQEIVGFKAHSIVFECIVPENGCDRGQALLDQALGTESSAVICLGMDSEKKGLCLETAARNKIESKYCLAHMNGKPIATDLPYDEKITVDTTQWNVDKCIAECRRQNVPVMNVSAEQGGFCCNHLLFQLGMLQRLGSFRIPFIFVHFPCSPEAVENHELHRGSGKVLMSIEEMTKGLGILLSNASL